MSEILKRQDFLTTEVVAEVVSEPIVKKRGRPKGAKNKIKPPVPPQIDGVEQVEVKRSGRGRPKGSKNKPKTGTPILGEPAAPIEPGSVGDKPRRGRPKGSKNKPKAEVSKVLVLAKPRGRPRKETLPEAAENKGELIKDKETPALHPLMEVAKWIEKHMHPGQMSYYRRRVTSMGVSLHTVIALDIMGLFSISDPDIRKQIKTTAE
jgi:hypothetical protein